MIADYTSGNGPASPTRQYVYGDQIDNVLVMLRTSDEIYYHADAQTSIRCLTNNTGSLVESYLYTAYGVPTIFNGTGTKISATAYDNRFLYTAREWDHKTYQYDFRARWYSPGLGRFTSRDPLHYVDGPSLYRGYFNPGNVDPSGLQKDDKCDVIKEYDTCKVNIFAGHNFEAQEMVRDNYEIIDDVPIIPNNELVAGVGCGINNIPGIENSRSLQDHIFYKNRCNYFDVDKTVKFRNPDNPFQYIRWNNSRDIDDDLYAFVASQVLNNTIRAARNAAKRMCKGIKPKGQEDSDCCPIKCGVVKIHVQCSPDMKQLTETGRFIDLNTGEARKFKPFSGLCNGKEIIIRCR